jgi:hypothetical protein
VSEWSFTTISFANFNAVSVSISVTFAFLVAIGVVFIDFIPVSVAFANIVVVSVTFVNFNTVAVAFANLFVVSVAVINFNTIGFAFANLIVIGVAFINFNTVGVAFAKFVAVRVTFRCARLARVDRLRRYGVQHRSTERADQCRGHAVWRQRYSSQAPPSISFERVTLTVKVANGCLTEASSVGYTANFNEVTIGDGSAQTLTSTHAWPLACTLTPCLGSDYM